MNRFLQSLFVLLTTFFLFSSTTISGQFCVNNPVIHTGQMTSTTGPGALDFSFYENLLDYTDDENNPIRLEICLLGIEPVNGAFSVFGTFSSQFSWTYDSAINSLIGIQSSDILGGTGGTIGVNYDLINTGSCPSLDIGFVAEVLIPGCMYLINDTFDDVVTVITSSYNSSISTVKTECFGSNGSATYNFGSGSFDLLWSTGETTQTITGLSPGYYGLTITDLSNSCAYERTAKVRSDTICFSEIKGNIIIDHDVSDCTVDTTSYPSINRTVRLYESGQILQVTKSNSLGEYRFGRLDNGNYTVEVGLNPLDLFNCATTNQQSITISALGINTVDFIHDVVPNQNLCIFHNIGVARPGFDQNHSIEYCNLGTSAMSGDVEFIHDPLTHSFNPAANSIPTSYDSTTQTAIWSFANLAPGQCTKVYFQVTIEQPPTVNNGDTLSFQASVSPFSNDIDLENNFMNRDIIVVGSYDPNDKQNLVGESSWGGPVEPDDDQFKYYIRFQNTGTDTAFNVVIKDEIHPNLDISTVRPVSSSHSYNLSTENTNTLVFSFNDILLVDSTTNEPASNGYVCFTIDLLPNLPLGTVIENEAAIYFDFNLPVITNLVTNTITDLQTSTTDWQTFDGSVTVYPNPSFGTMNLDLTLSTPDVITIELLNVNGQYLDRLVLNQQFDKGKHILPLGIGYNTPGLYLIRVMGSQGAKTLKVVKF